VIVSVYALVSPSPARLTVTGVGGERLKVITVDRIGAIVGELRRAPAPSVRNLRRYAAVVESIAAKTSAILPARFGTTAADADELSFIIRSRRTALRQRLSAVRGRAQMTIRLMGSDPLNDLCGGQTPSTSRISVGDGATQGTQYLRQKMADAAAARTVPAFDVIRQAIQRYVKDERVEKRDGIVTINHLVAHGSVERYRDAVEGTAEDCGVRLIVTGPGAPYAFADTW
jgi:gas vesicle protein GvpL/GvpF